MADPEEAVVAKKEKAAPRLIFRLAAWCCLYMSAVALNVVDFSRATGIPWEGTKAFLSQFLIWLVAFPLVGFLGYSGMLFEFRSSLVAALVLEAILIVAYGAFVLSLCLVCSAKTRKVFAWAMVLLVLLSAGNLTACHCEIKAGLHQPREPAY